MYLCCCYRDGLNGIVFVSRKMKVFSFIWAKIPEICTMKKTHIHTKSIAHLKHFKSNMPYNHSNVPCYIHDYNWENSLPQIQSNFLLDGVTNWISVVTLFAHVRKVSFNPSNMCFIFFTILTSFIYLCCIFSTSNVSELQ